MKSSLTSQWKVSQRPLQEISRSWKNIWVKAVVAEWYLQPVIQEMEVKVARAWSLPCLPLLRKVLSSWPHVCQLRVTASCTPRDILRRTNTTRLSHCSCALSNTWPRSAPLNLTDFGTYAGSPLTTFYEAGVLCHRMPTTPPILSLVELPLACHIPLSPLTSRQQPRRTARSETPSGFHSDSSGSLVISLVCIKVFSFLAFCTTF